MSDYSLIKPRPERQQPSSWQKVHKLKLNSDGFSFEAVKELQEAGYIDRPGTYVLIIHQHAPNDDLGIVFDVREETKTVEQTYTVEEVSYEADLGPQFARFNA